MAVDCEFVSRNGERKYLPGKPATIDCRLGSQGVSVAADGWRRVGTQTGATGATQLTVGDALYNAWAVQLAAQWDSWKGAPFFVELYTPGGRTVAPGWAVSKLKGAVLLAASLATALEETIEWDIERACYDGRKWQELAAHNLSIRPPQTLDEPPTASSGQEAGDGTHAGTTDD